MKELQNLMSIGDVAKSFGVCVATVRRWCKNGKFSRVIRTIGNQRRFDPDEVHEILHPNLDKRIMVGYARVSSYDQRSDLAAQAERLSHYGCQLVIKDLGSGLNCKKAGAQAFIETAFTSSYRHVGSYSRRSTPPIRYRIDLLHRSLHGHSRSHP